MQNHDLFLEKFRVFSSFPLVHLQPSLIRYDDIFFIFGLHPFPHLFHATVNPRRCTFGLEKENKKYRSL